MQKVTLNNGIEMPMEGFGVFQITDEAQCEQAVLDALEAGYRLIDIAAVYQNEKAVGAAIRKSGIPREDLFITTKLWIRDYGLWIQDYGYENTKKAFAASLERIGLDYIDLYLLHHSLSGYDGSWRALEELYREGKIRAVGICNFSLDRLADLCANARIMPAVNQIEYPPSFQRIANMENRKDFGVQIEAWGPLAEGQKNIFHNKMLMDIGAKYGKTAEQVILRWYIQRGVVVIPKSVHKNRMEENINIWDFSLSEEDMEQIASMDTEHSDVIDYSSPQKLKW